MYKYIIEFSKRGIISYTSHLDLLRLFKRSFKRAGIMLSYSQGFNPHPKMSFAQALSLGYESTCELIEFETTIDYDENDIANKMQSLMPQGLTIISCKKVTSKIKSIAALVKSAKYRVTVPIAVDQGQTIEFFNKYMNQSEIITKKKQKKTKKFVEVNIKDKIRKIDNISIDNNLSFILHLDCGSISNLSPELVLNSMLDFAIESELNNCDYLHKLRKLSKITRIQFFFDVTSV